MKTIKKLTVKSLRMNRKRTIGTIIGIILSVALICAVSSMVLSLRKTLIKAAVNQTGYYHLMVSVGVNQEAEMTEKLKANRATDKIWTVDSVSFPVSTGQKADHKAKEEEEIFQLDISPADTLTYLKYHLTKGDMPASPDEIVLSEKAAVMLGADIGTRVELAENDYTVSGIVEKRSWDFLGATIPGEKNDRLIKECTRLQSSNPENSEVSCSSNLYVSLKDLKGIDKTLDCFYELTEETEVAYITNNAELLRWECFRMSDTTVDMLNGLAGIIIFIIILTSVFCIRNSFAISVSEKIKMYAMLSSVGATAKQIRASVLYEGLILGLIGIPLGVGLGLLATGILCIIAGRLMEINGADGFTFATSALILGMTVLLGFLTIYLSAFSAARKAGKVSPIENLRNADRIRLDKKKLRTSKSIQRIFGEGGVIAYKNLKRSRKKYRTTVISITVSVFTFIAISGFLHDGMAANEEFFQGSEVNLILRIFDKSVAMARQAVDGKSCADDEIKVFLNDSSKVEAYSISYPSMAAYKISQSCIDERLLAKNTDEAEIYSGGAGVVLLSERAFAEYAKAVGSTSEEIGAGGVLCDMTDYTDGDGKEISIHEYKIKKGDAPGRLTGFSGKNKAEGKAVRIAEITDIRPMGYQNIYNNDGYLFLNEKYYGGLKTDSELYYSIQARNDREAEKTIQAILDRYSIVDASLSNLAEDQRQVKNTILLFSIFLYGFITVISLIGVTNIFNTITSNMELRQKEFAILKSVGMTSGEFRSMVNLETLFYSVKALFFGILTGCIGALAFRRAYMQRITFESGIYIPWKACLISIFAVSILIYVIMRYSMSQINRQNVIETIRNDNI